MPLEKNSQEGGRRKMDVLRQLWALKAPILTTTVILALLDLALDDRRYVRCGYVVLVMAMLWLTEAIPIPATALLPIVLFPMCGVLQAKEVGKSYINDTSMLFLGGLILAVAVEEWGLHKRVALGVLRIVGSDPKFVMLGLMLPTWFLSMWISNTATASMMIPIANAVAKQMGTVKKDDNDTGTGHDSETTAVTDNKAVQPSAPPTGERYVYHGDQTDSSKTIEVENTVNPRGDLTKDGPPDYDSLHQTESVTVSTSSPDPVVTEVLAEEQTVQGEEDRAYQLLCKGLALCIAYGCNIGGIATLTGTPPNLVFKGQADDLFNARYMNLSMEPQGAGITFANWMGMALPMSFLVLAMGWVLLMILFLRGNMFKKIDPAQKMRVKEVIRQEWRSLGPMSLAEIEVLILFICMAVMLISRDPKESPGWTVWFMTGYVSDASAVMIIAVLLFILPAKVPRVFCLRTAEHINEPYYVPLLNWEQVNRKLPWGVIILLGGGFALANACVQSGLSAWLGEKLNGLSALDTWVLNLVLCLIVACATEVTSNTATSTLLMPIMAEIAQNIGVNPLYLMASAAMATSFAFMLPVATPPNAIVFSYGTLQVIDMASTGLIMNGLAVLGLTLAVNTWGAAIFDFFEVPLIFDKTQNITRSA